MMMMDMFVLPIICLFFYFAIFSTGAINFGFVLPCFNNHFQLSALISFLQLSFDFVVGKPLLCASATNHGQLLYRIFWQ